MSRLIGKVNWFDHKKGFGIISMGDKEYFVHHSEILTKTNNYKNLNENEVVEFEIGMDKKNRECAKKVTGPKGEQLLFEKEPFLPKKKNVKKKRYKNTQNFNPSHAPSEMRVIIGDPNQKKFNREMQTRDVTLVNGLFGSSSNMTIYENLLKEVNSCDKDNKLWKLWHGDTHLIVDDKLNWKKSCPTFDMVIKKVEEYFDMEVKATRFNLYKNSDHWKPFHHDAAAIKPHIAEKQNFTVGISFGAERDAAFEHAKNKSVISIPLPNGSIYCFAKDVNIMWKHGILQVPPEKKHEEGRISIIAWGKNKQIDV